MFGTETRARLDRAAAIPLIGLGAALCCSMEYVQNNMPELASLPGLAGSASALTGVLLLFNSQRRARREAQARHEAGLRIVPYIPEMADGSDGAAALRRALAPAAADAPARGPAAQGARQAKRQVRVQSAPKAHLHLVGHPETRRRVSSARSARNSLCSALKLGNEWSRDLKLSPRAMARLDADPFVQRLARLG